MQIEISETTKSVMADLESGAAFDTTILDEIGSMEGEWDILASDSDNLFGKYSSLTMEGAFEKIGGGGRMLDYTDLDAMPDLTETQKENLLGKPAGVLGTFKNQAEEQFKNLTTNLPIYTTGQKVQNSLNGTSGCGGLTEAFGTISDIGKNVAGMVKTAKGAIDQFKALKTQLTNEINNFDNNVIGILTGQINGTILSDLVAGSGLHDQVDNILISSGIAKDSEKAQQIKSEIFERLTPNLNDFFNKKAGVNESVKAISDQREGLFGQVAKELDVFHKAVSTLRTLGIAKSFQTLFEVDECAQTLLGHVGTSGFISKLKG